MGHSLTALIGTPAVLAALASRFGRPEPSTLRFGLVVLPLTEERLDSLARFDEPSFANFTYLVPALESGIARAAPVGRLLYVETDYFGGVGSQGAALFDDGRLVWREATTIERAPRSRRGMGPADRSPVSRGLFELGVEAGPDGDEFDAVGLGEIGAPDACGD